MVGFDCPTCGFHLEADESYRGQASNCIQCNNRLTVPWKSARSGPSLTAQVVGGIALLLLVLGIGGALYYGLAFDTTVEVPGNVFGISRVHNIHLASQRQTGLTVSIGGAILGAVLTAVKGRV